ncbi:MAG TPA: hypothetical protein VG672_02620 [Bryobacteraceae bacterium]|nr:hypothetical protein [Bryobacteraceae bacterium]
MSIAAPTLPRRLRVPRTRFMIVALMCALSGMSYFDRTIMSIAGPVIMKESHISGFVSAGTGYETPCVRSSYHQFLRSFVGCP